MIKNAEKLIRDIDKEIENWDERSQFKLKGVGNLSFSDMDILKLYAETCIRTGSFRGLMEPRGEIAKVLSKYGIV